MYHVFIRAFHGYSRQFSMCDVTKMYACNRNRDMEQPAVKTNRHGRWPHKTVAANDGIVSVSQVRSGVRILLLGWYTDNQVPQNRGQQVRARIDRGICLFEGEGEGDQPIRQKCRESLLDVQGVLQYVTL